MNFFSNIIKKIKASNPASSSSYDKKLYKPLNDWKIIIFVSQLVVIILGLVAVYFYYQVERGKIFTVEVDEFNDEVKINTTLLTKISQDLIKKEEVFNSVRSSKDVYKDPSI